MRLPRSPVDTAILSTLLFPLLTAGINLACDYIKQDDAVWEFKSLGGPKSVMHSVDNGLSWTNTTYTIDICQPLKRSGNRKKPVDEDDECPFGTRRKLLLSLFPRLRVAEESFGDANGSYSLQHPACNQQGRRD